MNQPSSPCPVSSCWGASPFLLLGRPSPPLTYPPHLFLFGYHHQLTFSLEPEPTSSLCFLVPHRSVWSSSFRPESHPHELFCLLLTVSDQKLDSLRKPYISSLSSSSSSFLHPFHTVCLTVPTVSVAASRAIVTSSDVQATVQHWGRWPAPPVPSVLLSTKFAEFSPIRCLLLLLCSAEQASAISSFQAQGELLYSLILVLVYRTKQVSV